MPGGGLPVAVLLLLGGWWWLWSWWSWRLLITVAWRGRRRALLVVEIATVLRRRGTRVPAVVAGAGVARHGCYV